MAATRKKNKFARWERRLLVNSKTFRGIRFFARVCAFPSIRSFVRCTYIVVYSRDVKNLMGFVKLVILEMDAKCCTSRVPLAPRARALRSDLSGRQTLLDSILLVIESRLYVRVRKQEREKKRGKKGREKEKERRDISRGLKRMEARSGRMQIAPSTASLSARASTNDFRLER